MLILSLSCVWAFAATDQEVAIIKRAADDASSLAAEALMQQPLQGTRITSGARLSSAMLIAGVVPQSTDDATAKKLFREAREEAKRATDPIMARLASQRAVNAAASLSFAEIEFRQTGLIVALQELLKAIAAANEDAEEIQPLLEELAIRNQFDEHTALPPALAKRYARTSAALRRQEQVPIELLARGGTEGAGEFSIDGAPMRALATREVISVTPGPHEIFVRWGGSFGWTRRIEARPGIIRTLTFVRETERRLRVEPDGVVLMEGAFDANLASAIAAMANVDEVWCVEQAAGGRLLVSVFAAERVARAFIDVGGAGELPVSVMRMALATARSGRATEVVSGYEAVAQGGHDFRVSKTPVIEGPRPVYQQWWFWTIVGVVVAGGAAGVAAGVVASQNRTQAPNEIQLQLQFGL